MAAEPSCYTVITDVDDSEPPSEQQLRADLEKGDLRTKISALKRVILLLNQGERLPSLLMVIIRFVLPQDDHTLKKLLLLYWEIIPKTSADGKLLHEMILVCDAYRKDLQSPNEFVRGSTLRFLCKLKEPELIEPLIPAIRENLSHRHYYVRRNAVLAIFSIYKHFEHLIPDAPELIHNLLESESDSSCKRNAFMMLISVDQDRALDYLGTCIDQVHTFNEILQLFIVELVHKVCRTDPLKRAKFIRVIHNLLESSSNAVRYEAAGTLVSLLSAPKVVSAAVSCYTDLILKESDNNVKLIVLDRLMNLKNSANHERVLQGSVMDILRVVSASDLQVRRKTMELCLGLLSNRNAAEVAGFLKKELSKSSGEGEFEKMEEYRQLLVRSLHTCGVKFPDTAPSIVPQLMEFLSDSAAADVIVFVREAFERMPHLRSEMLAQLLANFGNIRASKVSRAALWIIGEYASTSEDIKAAIQTFKTALGALPIVDTEMRAAADIAAAEATPEEAKVVTRTRITADGTYATESSYVSAAAPIQAEKPALRKLLLDGDFFVSASLAVALTKLALRYQEGNNNTDANAVKAEAMYILASVVHLGKSGLVAQADDDSLSRISVCVRVLAEPSPALSNLFLAQCQAAFQSMLASLQEADKPVSKDVVAAQADDLISFRGLKSKEEQSVEDQFDLDLKQATGSDEKDSATSKLNKVFQLSGFSDPVYAEAYVHVHQYDILLDVLVVNQTADTLQGLTLELATHGDLKLTEKPSIHTLGPHDFCSIRANVKVSSTETGIIYGNIVYDVSGSSSDRNVVVLNDIHIDIMDYITPASCTESEFRSMWLDFEWVNTVPVRTKITSLRAYLDHLLATTNMRSLTPASALQGECDFLAANLYARSVFGEDALANVSLEKMPDGQITGQIRIRSKTQGIALSLGDKITYTQEAASAH